MLGGSVMTAEWLLQRVRAITDPLMRRRAVVAILSQADPHVAAAAAEDLIGRAARSGDDHELAAGLACLLQALGELPYPVRQALYAAARARDAAALGRLLIDASPATADDDQLRRQLQPERPMRPRGRPLTLGERKALARAPRRDLMQHLIRDPHPDVVRILLDNPLLTEREAVALAAARPAVPAALVVIASHPRWSVRHMVRRALVFNPHTPVHVALRLATTLTTADWREIAGDPHLPDPLRAHTRELTASASARRR